MVIDSYIGQGSAVKLNTCQVKPLDKTVICHSFRTDSYIDTGDPQFAEIPFARLAVTEVVVKGVQELFLSFAVKA